MPSCPYSGVVPVPHSPQADAALAQAALDDEKNHGASSADVKAPVPWAFRDGWWLDSWWTAPTQVTLFSAQWTVPPDPASTGALLFFFPSIHSTPDHAHIVQPVLQWGKNGTDGGVNYWTMSNWYYHNTANQAHTTPMRTYAGHRISGAMTRATSTTNQWGISFRDQTAGVTKSLTARTGATNWRDLQGGVMEVYHVTSCKQLPTGPITFNAYVVSGTATPAFYAHGNSSSCFGAVTASSVSTKLSWSTTA